MRVLCRVLGWLALAMAVAVAVRDALDWWSEGRLHLIGLGELWAHLDPASFARWQALAERSAASGSWTWLAQPVLAVPALLAGLAAAAILLRLGRPREPDEVNLLTGARPRRRRRGRGALS